MLRTEPAGIQRITKEAAKPGYLADSGISSAGSPLPTTTRKAMEVRFGHAFDNVRIHADDHADEASRSLQAKAYTVGDSIAFRDGAFAPHTSDGEELLAHELTHVVQQSASGPVGSALGLEVSEPDDASEREADQIAQEASGPAFADASAASGAEVYRWPDDETDLMPGDDPNSQMCTPLPNTSSSIGGGNGGSGGSGGDGYGGNEGSSGVDPSTLPPTSTMSPGVASGLESMIGDAVSIPAGPLKMGYDAMRAGGSLLSGDPSGAWGATKDLGMDVLTKNPVASVGTLAYDTTMTGMRAFGASPITTPLSGELFSEAVDTVLTGDTNQPPQPPPGEWQPAEGTTS
jgi:hypothetical protein